MYSCERSLGAAGVAEDAVQSTGDPCLAVVGGVLVAQGGVGSRVGGCRPWRRSRSDGRRVVIAGESGSWGARRPGGEVVPSSDGRCVLDCPRKAGGWSRWRGGARNGERSSWGPPSEKIWHVMARADLIEGPREVRQSRDSPLTCGNIGAGDGNRTRAISLGS